MGEIMEKGYILPQNLIVLISGVPGVGKTTISNELLKTHNEFRLVEETDIIREVLRGYESYLTKIGKLHTENIYSHDIILSYEIAMQQCHIMKNPLINIIKRQQRKQIPSIINGVHIIPEELYAHTSFPNILYIILYVDSEDALWNHLKNRDPQKYTYQCVPFLYKTNLELRNSIQRIPQETCMLHSIDVSNLSIEDTISNIDNIFDRLFGNTKTNL